MRKSFNNFYPKVKTFLLLLICFFALKSLPDIWNFYLPNEEVEQTNEKPTIGVKFENVDKRFRGELESDGNKYRVKVIDGPWGSNYTPLFKSNCTPSGVTLTDLNKVIDIRCQH